MQKLIRRLYRTWLLLPVAFVILVGLSTYSGNSNHSVYSETEVAQAFSDYAMSKTKWQEPNEVGIVGPVCSHGYFDDCAYYSVITKGPMFPQRFTQALPFSSGLAAIEHMGKWGFIDTSGNHFIAPKYDRVGSFEHGYAPVLSNGKIGLIDRRGDWVVPANYNSISPISSKYAIFWNKGKPFVNRSGGLTSASLSPQSLVNAGILNIETKKSVIRAPRLELIAPNTDYIWRLSRPQFSERYSRTLVSLTGETIYKIPDAALKNAQIDHAGLYIIAIGQGKTEARSIYESLVFLDNRTISLEGSYRKISTWADKVIIIIKDKSGFRHFSESDLENRVYRYDTKNHRGPKELSFLSSDDVLMVGKGRSEVLKKKTYERVITDEEKQKIESEYQSLIEHDHFKGVLDATTETTLRQFASAKVIQEQKFLRGEELQQTASERVITDAEEEKIELEYQKLTKHDYFKDGVDAATEKTFRQIARDNVFREQTRLQREAQRADTLRKSMSGRERERFCAQGYARKSKHWNKWGIKDAQGRWLIEPDYRALTCYKNGIAWGVKRHDKQGWCPIGRDGKRIEDINCRKVMFFGPCQYERLHKDDEKNSIILARALLDYGAGIRLTRPKLSKNQSIECPTMVQ